MKQDTIPNLGGIWIQGGGEGGVLGTAQPKNLKKIEEEKNCEIEKRELWKTCYFPNFSHFPRLPLSQTCPDLYIWSWSRIKQDPDLELIAHIDDISTPL